MIFFVLWSSKSSSNFSSLWYESMDSKDIWLFELWISFNVWSPYLYVFNLVTLTNTGFGSKLLTKTRRTILVGKEYYTLNGANHLFLNLPRCVFSPLGNWNLFFVCFRWLHKNMFISLPQHCYDLPLCFLVTYPTL